MKSVHLGVLAVALLASGAQAQQCKSYPRMQGGQEVGPLRAPDGAMWYANISGNRIVRMDDNFKETPFVPVNGSTGGLSGIAFDDSGNVWYSKAHGRAVGKFPMAGGEGVEYALPQEYAETRLLEDAPEDGAADNEEASDDAGETGGSLALTDDEEAA